MPNPFHSGRQKKSAKEKRARQSLSTAEWEAAQQSPPLVDDVSVTVKDRVVSGPVAHVVDQPDEKESSNESEESVESLGEPEEEEKTTVAAKKAAARKAAARKVAARKTATATRSSSVQQKSKTSQDDDS